MATIDFVVKNGLVVTEEAQVLSTTDATSSTDTDASIHTAGGAAIEKKVYVGTDLAVGGATTLTGDIAVNGGDLTTTASTFNLVNTNATTVNLAGAATDVQIGSASGTTNVNNNLDVDGDVNIDGGDLTVSTSTFNLANSNATTVNAFGAATSIEIGSSSGTTNINNNLDVDGDVNIDGGDLTVSTTTFNLANTTATTLNIGGDATAINAGAAGSAGTFNIKNDNVVLDGDLQIKGGDLTTNQSTFNLFNATATTLNIGGAATTVEIGAATGTTNVNNNLDVDGDVNIDGGDLTVSTTTFNLANTTATTVNFAGDAVAVNIGNATGTATIRNATTTITGNANVNGGTLATNQSTFNLLNTDATTVNFAGAATTLEIGSATGTTNINNDLVVDGDVQVKGGDLTTNQTTFNLVNATATTVNFAGAATDVQIGAATGTTNVNNNLDVDGDVNIDGGDLTVSTSTFNLANATATTLNIGSDASTARLGAGTGTLTLGNPTVVGTAATQNLYNTTATTVNAFGDATSIVLGAATGTTNIKHNLDVDGDINLDGGDITASSSTFNLINTTATTVNFAGAATTVEIGAATGTTNVNNNLVVDGDVQVKGGDLTTDQTTFNLLNVTPTTINFGGAATVIEIGSSSGTTNINNNLDVDGDVNIDGGDLTVSTTTFNLANTTATTVNIGGEATAVNIGAAGSAGTATIKNDSVVLDGDLQVKGGDITTNQTTFNLINTNATTLNIGGAATTVEIGSSTGTTNVNNNLDVDGDVNIDGGDLTVSTTTFNLANTTATTLNIGSDAATARLGANSGTLTLGNPTVVGTASTQNLYNTTATTVNAFGAATSIVMGSATGTTNIKHNLDVDGDINIDGGDLTVSGSTFNLANTTATTVNIAGAGTAVNIGAATGNTTINNNLVTAGDVQIKGGDLTTDQTTFNLINANATTVNFAGAATTVEIGSSSGTTNINNNLDVDGDVNIDGGDLTVSTSTFNLANTTATTLNIGGDALTVEIGAATGTTNVNNNLVVDLDLQVKGGDITTDQTTFNLINTNATTVNLAGAATTIEIGSASGTTNVNNNLVVDGDVQVKGGDITTDQTTFNLLNVTPTTINFGGAATVIEIGSATGTTNVNNNLDVDGDINIDGGDLTVSTTTFNLANTTATTGNLFGAATTINMGAAGSAGTTTIKTDNVVIDGDLQVKGGDITTTAGTFNLLNATATTVNFAGAGTAITIGDTTGTTTIRNANTVVTGDLAVNGGDITTSSTGTATVFNTNATTLNVGGAATAVNIGSATGNTTVNNSLIVTGDLTVNGTTTTLNTATLDVEDLNITVAKGAATAAAANGAGLTVDGANATITYASTGDKWTFNKSIDVTGTGNFSSDLTVGGTLSITGTTTFTGDIAVNGGDITTTSGTATVFNTNATTLNMGSAATTVSIGSAGGAGTLTIKNDNVSLDGDLQVKGGDLTTNQTTFNLINATATTLNIGGAATDIQIGAATGTTNINNDLDVDGDVNIDGGDLTVSTTTFNLANTTATTGNLFGAATTVNIGAAGSAGTLTVKNDNVVIDGDLQIKGGDLTTNQLTFNLLNSTATTVNFAGAGTAVNIGSATGTTTINNANTVVTGDLAVNGGDITTSSASATVFNTTATTVNAFGAATTVSIGAGTGTTTINNATTTITGNANINGGTLATNQTTFNLVNTTATTGNLFGAATTVNIGAAGSAGTLTVKNDNVTLDGDLQVKGGDITTNQSTFNLLNTTVSTGNLFGAATTVNIGSAGLAGTLTIKNDNVVMDGDLQVKGGDLTTNQTTFNLVNTTATTVNFAGAGTTVNIGAAGSAGTLTVKNDNVTLDGDLQVKGGDLTTNQTTFNLVNATATTVNFAGAATSLVVGATSGTTNVRNNLDVDGDINIDGGDITVSTSTFNLANTTANIINFGGAATTVNIGATTGTTAVKNSLTVDGDTTLGNASGDALTINSSTVSIPNSISFTKDDITNTSVSYPISLTHTTSGIPGTGIGTGLQFVTETANDVNKTGLSIEAVTTDITSTSEDFDFVVKTMIAGASAAQVLKLNGTTAQLGANNTNLTVTTQGTGDLVLNTNSGTNSGSITIANGLAGNITIEPNTTGDIYLNADTVRVGDQNANVTVTTWGTSDLLLNTNSGTNSGSITIANGANGNITIEPNGTGDVYLNADTIRIGDNNVDAVVTTQGTANIILNPGTDLVVGTASSSASPTAKIIRPTNGSGTDIAAANLQLQGGLSTGSATGGAITFATGTTLASGITGQTATTRLTIPVGAASTTLDLVTTMTTANVLNTGATTVNAFGAATSLIIGAASGTTNVRNALDVDGDVNIDGGDLTVSTSTFNLANTTATTGNLFGAATTVNIGAAGSAGTLTVKNDNVVIDGDLQVKGGDITTNQATFNLLNATATTVNAFGGATSIVLGSATGTTNIKHNLDVDGDVNIDGGDLTVSGTTFNLANTTITTGNLFGAATTVNIGAAGSAGTLTIKNDNVTLDGDLQVKGGDLTTNQLTFNLVNTTATTVNFAGAATTIEIGSASGTTNINNNLDVDGDVNIDGGDLTVSTATFNLANANATTVNAFGAATSVVIGTTSGTTNIKHNLDVDGDVNIDGGDLTVSTTTFNLANTTATTGNLFGAATTVNIGSAGGAGTLTIKNDNVTLDGDLQIKGGDLTTNQTTFNLINATATTVNFAGAATTLEIGSASGTTNINNNLDVDGDVNIDGGDLTVSTATFNIANTTATTGNLFGAGTAVNIGTSAASASTLTFGPAITANTFKISSITNGTVNLSSDVTTGTVNLYTGVTTGTVNVATGGASTINLGGTASTTYIGTTSGNNILEVRGNATSGTATIRTNTGVTTANVFNTVATTGNLFGAATAVNIGTTSGTTTINSPTVVGSQTTVNLWNTTSTTVNAFGVAPAINLGINAAELATLTFGPAITGNIFKIAGTASGTVNLTSDVTTGTVNAYTGITTGTVNIATGGASTTNIGGAAGNVNIGTTGGDSTLTIRGNATTGTGTVATNAATANVFNANATTVNAFGAATAVNIGAATGTVTIANPTVTMTNGTALNINGTNPVIASSDTGTASIFNSNITAINFGQAANISMGSTSGTVTTRGALQVNGNTTLGDATSDLVTYTANTAVVNNTLTFTLDDVENAAVSYPVKVRHTTSGTPAAGIGSGIQFVAETSSNNNTIGAAVEAVSTDATLSSEAFDLVFRTMTGGAAASQSLKINNTTATIGAASANVTVNTQTSSNLTVTTGAVGAAAAGATLTASGGAGGATSGAGGAATFKGGDATTSGTGGVATFKAGAAVGTNIAGANTIVEAGNGTGTGGSGSIVFRTAPTGVSGAAADTMTDRLTIAASGVATFTGNVTSNGTVTGTQLISSVSTGTAPLSVTSTTVVSNLNADLLDGQQGSWYQDWTNITNKPDPVVTVTLSGDVTGTANTTLTDLTSGTISIATTIAADSVALGTDTTGNYVASLVAGTGISLANNTGEGATPTITNSGVTSLTAGGAITLSASTGGVTVSHTDTSTQATVTNTNGTVIQSLTLDTYGHLTAISSLDLDLRYLGISATATAATNIAGGAANRIPYQTGASTTGFIAAPTVASTYLQWTGSAFAWAAASGGGVSPWTKKTTTYTAVSGDRIIADTSAGPFTITLPASPTTGTSVSFADGESWRTNNLTIARNGQTIEGLAEDLVVDVPGVTLEFIFDGTTWEWFTLVGSTANVANDTTTNTTQYLAMVRNTTGNLASVYVDNTGLYFNPSTGALNATDFNSLSDVNKKYNITTITNAVDTVSKLRGVDFQWKDTDAKSMGVIAQEIEKVLPQVVSTSEDGIKSVSYGNLVGLLIEALKEQQQQIEEIKKWLH